ncbi:PREDICTED: plasminogen-like [Branchiostoma belcheri]|uniref:Plasminogen-like n=1 Tax=Branchiostoma belcheri TaxID=7741 RepID=A0A6P5ABQ6_BRABE|nr:PREDICTED: plasminogen-like [Branchiostoma belcheri]
MPVADTTVSPEGHECQISDGASYRGKVAVTKSGRTCQRWDQQTPHEHSRTAANYPSSGLEENFCRNPDGTSGVWCYTTDPNKRWELCDVAVCGSLSGNPTTQQPVSTEVKTTTGCPIPGYIPLNGACYKKFAEPKTYAEARERCAADGGLIAMPRDRATNRFITNLHPGVMSWIGLTNINSEGQWVFEDGQTLESSDYSNWFHTEPNDADGNEDCAQVRARGFWNDVRCSTTIGFTCQIGHGKSVKEFYQGCYKDGERRRLPHAFLVRADMTADVCVQHCRQKGYTYAGTQYYKECWCGSELPTRGPREDSECATPCGGNQKEMCGGEWRLSVYKAMPVADITTVSPEEHECQISDGALYRGNVAVTKSGRTCQRWDQQTPHEHSRTAANYPSSGLEENFCRNPDGTSGVWCYTTDPNKRWELCDVAVCGTYSGHATIEQNYGRFFGDASRGGAVGIVLRLSLKIF